MMHEIRWSKRFAAALLLCALAACGAKLSQANYEQVKDGMTSAQVRSILGAPTEMNTASLPLVGTVTTYTYRTKKSEATFIFYEDKLKTKAGTIVE